jgi:predicted DNA-binding protein with PD1-like motif
MKYVEGRSARMICARLVQGEDLLITIRNLAEETGITSAAFFVIGTLTKANFYFYHPQPKPITIEKPLEIVSCSGSISKIDGKTIVHGHIDVTDSEYKSYGGHLLEGSIIDVMGFVAIFELMGANLADLEK